MSQQAKQTIQQVAPNLSKGPSKGARGWLNHSCTLSGGSRILLNQRHLTTAVVVGVGKDAVPTALAGDGRNDRWSQPSTGKHDTLHERERDK